MPTAAPPLPVPGSSIWQSAATASSCTPDWATERSVPGRSSPTGTSLTSAPPQACPRVRRGLPPRDESVGGPGRHRPAHRWRVSSTGFVVTSTGVDEDADLIDRLRAGDESAFVDLLGRYQARLLRLAQATVGSRAVAEEVTQDTWLAVMRGVDRFEGRSSFQTWLYRILINRARTAVGREQRAGRPDDTVEERFDGSGAWATPPVPWSDQVDDRMV